MVKSILWKYDSEHGIAYFCPSCKTFVCDTKPCRKCGQELDWDKEIQYKGRVRWS